MPIDVLVILRQIERGLQPFAIAKDMGATESTLLSALNTHRGMSYKKMRPLFRKGATADEIYDKYYKLASDTPPAPPPVKHAPMSVNTPEEATVALLQDILDVQSSIRNLLHEGIQMITTMVAEGKIIKDKRKGSGNPNAKPPFNPNALLWSPEESQTLIEAADNRRPGVTVSKLCEEVSSVLDNRKPSSVVSMYYNLRKQGKIKDKE